MKWTLWNHGIEMADWGMKIFRAGLAEHAWEEPKESLSRFQAVESRLDELRSYLYANRESIRGYAAGFRNLERVSTAHVESTVNQLINWRMCTKQQMSWSRAGAQYLLYVETAILNGGLEQYTEHRPSTMAARAPRFLTVSVSLRAGLRPASQNPDSSNQAGFTPKRRAGIVYKRRSQLSPYLSTPQILGLELPRVESQGRFFGRNPPLPGRNQPV